MKRKRKKIEFLQIIKKTIVATVTPFLPILIVIFAIIFIITTVVDTVFFMFDSSSNSYLDVDIKSIKNICIEKADTLNTCNNYIDGKEKTEYLLDVENRDNEKAIQWSHLYMLMLYSNMYNYLEIDKETLDEISKYFGSTFMYETDNIEIKTENPDTHEVTTKTEKQYILVESDTIMGHYYYDYETKTIKNGNTTTRKKVFKEERLVGTKYERLRRYMMENLNILSNDIDSEIDIVIASASGFSDSETTENSSTNNLASLASKDMFIWPIPGYTTISSHYGMRVHPITKVYKLHTGTDVSAPIGAEFVAMASGTVVQANYNNAYGNMVMIDHRKWY